MLPETVTCSADWTRHSWDLEGDINSPRRCFMARRTTSLSESVVTSRFGSKGGDLCMECAYQQARTENGMYR